MNGYQPNGYQPNGYQSERLPTLTGYQIEQVTNLNAHLLTRLFDTCSMPNFVPPHYIIRKQMKIKGRKFGIHRGRKFSYRIQQPNPFLKPFLDRG